MTDAPTQAKPRSRTGVRVKLTGDELTALGDVAASLGITRHAVLVKAVREIIGAVPELMNDDVRALEDANAQVHAVGRNLNQLVRAVNGGRGKGVNVDKAYLAVIAESVAATLIEIRKIAQRQRERWVFLAPASEPSPVEDTRT